MHSSSIVKLFAALVAASSPALAVLSMTSPIGTTTCTGGQSCVISWRDDGTAPSLAQQGNCTIALYTGGAQQQTFLQPIVYPGSVNVSTTGEVDFTVDPTVGPNGSEYFIRISSNTLTQTGSTNPYLSFSAKFTLAGMTGTFNSTVLGQISSAAASQSSTATSSHSTGAATTHATTSSSHTTSATHTGAGFRDGANGALVAGAALFAGAVALF